MNTMLIVVYKLYIYLYKKTSIEKVRVIFKEKNKYMLTFLVNGDSINTTRNCIQIKKTYTKYKNVFYVGMRKKVKEGTNYEIGIYRNR